MISKIHLTNFKGIKDTVTVEFKPITLLFGPNSAGKSTIVQALHYAKEIFERKNFDPRNTMIGGNAINLGGFKSLIHNHDFENSSIVLKFEIPFKREAIEIVGGDVSFGEGYWFDVEAGGFTQDEYSYDLPKLDDLMSQFVADTEITWIEIEVKWHKILKRAIVSQFELGINEQFLFRIVESRSTGTIIYYKISEINFSHPTLKKIFDEQLDLFKDIILDESGTVNLEAHNLFYAIPDFNEYFIFTEQFINKLKSEDVDGKECNDFLSAIKLFTNHVGNILLGELRKFRYIGPIREIPRRNYEKHFLDEEERWASGLAAWDMLYEGFPSETLVNEWLKKLKTGYKIELNNYRELTLDDQQISDLIQKNDTEILNALNTYLENDDKSKDNLEFELLQLFREYDSKGLVKHLKSLPIHTRLYLIDVARNLKLLPYDIGVGISQLIPVLIGALVQYSSILAIEQPELHTHPAIEVELGDLFISEINKRKDVIYLLETHSEHLMLRLLKRVRESGANINSDYKLHPDQITVLYVEQLDGEMSITPLELDDRGRFKNKWPRGFFEERHGELFG